MRAHKYAYRTDLKQDVLDLELVRLRTAGQDLPVAATAEQGRITTLWWNAVTGAWDFVERAHDPIQRPQGTLPAITAWNWSTTGLAASADEVFVVYKRSITPAGAAAAAAAQLYLDRLRLDPATGRLRFTAAAPLVLPITGLGFTRAGYHVWATHHAASNTLCLLLQVITTVPADDEDVVHYHGAIGQSLDPRPDIRFFDPRTTALGIPVDELIGSMEERGEGVLVREKPKPPDTVDRADLVLLTADLGVAGLDLSQAGSWSVDRVDDGGWDLDALPHADRITCVYRRDPYVVAISDATRVDPAITSVQDMPIPAALTDDAPYRGLFIRRLTVPAGAIDAAGSYDDVPGGGQPCLQHLDPLVLTVNRIADGLLKVHPPQTVSDPYMGDYDVPLQASPHIKTFSKVVLLRQQAAWARGELFRFSADGAPRNLVNGFGWINTERATGIEGSTANFGMLHDPHEVWKVAARVVENVHGVKKGMQLDVLHHLPEFEAVVVTPFILDLGGLALAPLRFSELVLDINHGQVRDALDPDASAEDVQFAPFRQSPYDLDNTLGGCLVRDRTTATLSFYGYTDLGDGGCRIVFQDNLPSPDPPLTSPRKGLDPATVVGPGAGADEWVEWNAVAWQPTHLPGYPVRLNVELMLVAAIAAAFGAEVEADELTPGAIGVGLQPALDSLIQLQRTNANDPALNPIVLGRAEIDTLESTLGMFYPDLDLEELLWAPYDQMSVAPDDTEYTYTLSHTALTIGKYRLEHFLDGQLARDRVEVTELPEHHASYRGWFGAQGQGELDFRFDITFSADGIRVDGPFADVLTVNSIDVTLGYGRLFTPGILMSEERSQDPLLAGPGSTAAGATYAVPKQLVDKSSSLAAVPHGNSKVEVLSIDADVSVGLTNLLAIGTIAMLLTTLGIAIGVLIWSLYTGLQASQALPWPYNLIVFLAILTTLVLLIVFLVPGLVKREVEKRIRERLEDDEFRRDLDKTELLTYAGEGLAETIARQVIQQINNGANPLPWGLDASGTLGVNRFADQFWQTIHVGGQQVRVLVRR